MRMLLMTLALLAALPGAAQRLRHERNFVWEGTYGNGGRWRADDRITSLLLNADSTVTAQYVTNRGVPYLPTSQGGSFFYRTGRLRLTLAGDSLSDVADSSFYGYDSKLQPFLGGYISWQFETVPNYAADIISRIAFYDSAFGSLYKSAPLDSVFTGKYFGILDVIVTADSGVLVVGTVYDDSPYDWDVGLVRLNRYGLPEYARRYPMFSLQEAHNIRPDTGGGYLISGTSWLGALLVTAVDAQGDLLYSQEIAERAYRMVQPIAYRMPDGGYRMPDGGYLASYGTYSDTAEVFRVDGQGRKV